MNWSDKFIFERRESIWVRSKLKKVSEEKRCKNCKGTGMVQIRTGVRGIGKIQKEDEK